MNLFVVGGQMIPDTHRAVHETEVTFRLLVGFCPMIIMNTSLG